MVNTTSDKFAHIIVDDAFKHLPPGAGEDLDPTMWKVDDIPDGGNAKFAWEPDPDLLRDILRERKVEREIERQAALAGVAPDLEPEPTTSAPLKVDRSQIETFVLTAKRDGPDGGRDEGRQGDRNRDRH